MRPIRTLLVGLLAGSGTGCFSARPSAPESFACQAARNSVEQPIRHHDDKKFIKVVRRRAEQAWAEACGAPGRRFSRAYHDGFVEGFIDYVEAGGSGEPPYLPPFRYRLTPYRTADGVAVIEDWYAGFRHGAAVARGSGMRELNVVPLPGPAIPAEGRPSDLLEPPAPPPSGGSPWEPPRVLPMPRPIPSAPAPIPPPRVVPDRPAQGTPLPPRAVLDPPAPPGAT
jgi:hypothetical protein